MRFGTLSYIAKIQRYEYEKPYLLTQVPSTDVPDGVITNLEFQREEGVKIRDARHMSKTHFSYDQHSFKFVHHKPATETKLSSESIRAYCKEMTEFVSREFGADRALCYDFRVGIPSSEILGIFGIITRKVHH